MRKRNQTAEIRALEDTILIELYERFGSVSKMAINLDITSSTALKLIATRLRELGILKGKNKTIATGKDNKHYKDVTYYLKNNGPFINTVKLKQKLIYENILKEICSECGQLPYWNSKPLVIELHHIDGNRKNNTLTNLCLLCPNCHTQTDNYKSKNTKKV